MYTQSITRTHRTAFILAIDGSGSMAEQILFRGRQMTKAQAVASVTNGMLFELIERARRSDGVRDYYDIAVIGYSGDDEVYSLLPGGKELISVAELAAGEPPIKKEAIEYRLPDGSVALREIPSPVWVEPEAAGQTPMCEALRRVRDIAAEWCADPAHADSFPPMVFNITDGEATDCDDAELRAVAKQIKSLGTTDGNVLLVNIHIAAGDTPHMVFFPSAIILHHSGRMLISTDFTPNTSPYPLRSNARRPSTSASSDTICASARTESSAAHCAASTGVPVHIHGAAHDASVFHVSGS